MPTCALRSSALQTGCCCKAAAKLGLCATCDRVASSRVEVTLCMTCSRCGSKCYTQACSHVEGTRAGHAALSHLGLGSPNI